jgi:hypothetical protein
MAFISVGQLHLFINAGAIDQHIEIAGKIRKTILGFAVGEIGDEAPHLLSIFAGHIGDGRFDQYLVSTMDHQFCALREELQGRCAAKAAR